MRASFYKSIFLIPLVYLGLSLLPCLLSASDPGIDRYGFEIELDPKQLEHIIDIFDFDSLQNGNPTLGQDLSANELNDYLADPRNFWHLKPEIQAKIISLLPPILFVEELKKRLTGELPRVEGLSKGPEKTRAAVAWKHVEEVWKNKITTEEKGSEIRLSRLSKKHRVELLLKYPYTAIRNDVALPASIHALLPHLKYHKDQQAIEFKYSDYYIVSNQDQFLRELHELSEFFGVTDLIENRVQKGENQDLSLHIHVSGPGVTDDYLHAWNLRIVLDYLEGGFQKELFIGPFHYTSDIRTKGFVKKVADQHGEIRDISLSPSQGLKLSTLDLIQSIQERMDPKTQRGQELRRRILKYQPTLLTDIYRRNHQWIQEGLLSEEKASVTEAEIVKEFLGFTAKYGLFNPFLEALHETKLSKKTLSDPQFQMRLATGLINSDSVDQTKASSILEQIEDMNPEVIKTLVLLFDQEDIVVQASAMRSLSGLKALDEQVQDKIATLLRRGSFFF